MLFICFAAFNAKLNRCRLLLGGGFGYLSAEHGLVIDNLEGATIVTGDGSVLKASATENADLFCKPIRFDF